MSSFAHLLYYISVSIIHSIEAGPIFDNSDVSNLIQLLLCVPANRTALEGREESALRLIGFAKYKLEIKSLSPGIIPIC